LNVGDKGEFYKGGVKKIVPRVKPGEKTVWENKK
jgi:hypothetical protein